MKFVRTAFPASLFILLAFAGNITAQNINFDFYDGVTYFENGEFEKAIKSLEKAVSNDPQLTDAYFYLASAHLGAEQFDKTVQTAQKGLDIAPEHVRLMLLKAEGYYRSDYRKAIPVYLEIEKTLKAEPDQQNAGIDLQQVQSYLGRLYQRRANDLYNTGNINNAIRDYRQARHFSPDSLNIHNNLAYILIKEERWSEAVEVLETATKLFPDAEQLLFMKGQAYKGDGQLKEMAETYRQLHEIDENNLNYAVIYGQALMVANQSQKANAFLQQLLEDHPKEKRLYEVLKKMNEQRFDFGAKRNVLKLQRSAFPEDRMVAEELAQTHVRIQEYEEARALYDSLTTATQSSEYAVQSARTWLYEEKYDEAANAYRSIVTNWPDKAKVLAEAAVIHEKNGDENQALDLYRRAFEREEEPVTAIRLTELLVKQGRVQEVLPYLRSVKETNYAGIGKYYELKYFEDDSDRHKMAVKAETIIVEIIKLYDSLQEEVSELSSQTLKGNHIVKPPLLHMREELNNMERYVNAWYDLITATFSTKEVSSILENIIADYSSSPKLYVFSGELAVKNGDVRKGIDYLKKAVSLGAQDPEVHVSLGDAYTQLGQIQSAILSFERALSLDDKFEKAYRRLIRVGQEYDRLEELCDRWLTRYSNNKDNEVLKQHLIEALHKADRVREANKIIGQR